MLKTKTYLTFWPTVAPVEDEFPVDILMLEIIGKYSE